MSKELEQRVAELQQELGELHAAHLDLFSRHKELVRENRLLWKFVATAREFQRFLHEQNAYADSKTYRRFHIGLDRLSEWLHRQIYHTEKQIAKITDPPKVE